MTTGLAGGHLEGKVASEKKSTEGRWEVKIHPGSHRITRVARYILTSQGEDPECEKLEDVIWPTWPATIEEETEVATTPLADLERYWSEAGNRLRESAKWMATVLGAALAAVIGTSPSADLSSHHLQAIAAAIGVVGLSCLAITMILVLRVMQPPEISFDQIEESNKTKAAQSSNHLSRQFSSWIHWYEKSALCRWKSKVETHPDLYLPCGIDRLKQLRSFIRLEEATLVELIRYRADTVDSGVAGDLKSAQEARAARLLELRAAAARITAIGEYYAVQV